MPGLDKTGPTGQGSLTGRQKGNCITTAELKSSENTRQRQYVGRARQEDTPQSQGGNSGMRRGTKRLFRKKRGRI